MSTTISNGTAGTGTPADAHLDIAALSALPVQPDMKSAPDRKEPEGQNFAQDASEPLGKLSSAASSPEIVSTTYLQADTKSSVSSISAVDTPATAVSTSSWTVSQELEFILLWRAIELTTTEVAEHFGMSERHLRRLKANLGLASRPDIRRLDRQARQHLVALEAFAPFTTLRGQSLLKVAQERRRVQDADRDAVAIEKATRQWWWRRKPPESADAKRLRTMQRRQLRAGRY